MNPWLVRLAQPSIANPDRRFNCWTGLFSALNQIGHTRERQIQGECLVGQAFEPVMPIKVGCSLILGIHQHGVGGNFRTRGPRQGIGRPGHQTPDCSDRGRTTRAAAATSICTSSRRSLRKRRCGRGWRCWRTSIGASANGASTWCSTPAEATRRSSALQSAMA